MAKCTQCGAKTSFMMAMCDSCIDALEAERQSHTYQANPHRSHASDKRHNQPPPPKPEAKAHHQPPPPKEHVPDELAHARVLGLRGQVTFADIKRHYRERMMEYHPDRVAALGPKLREVAEHETKKINAAYEFFTAKYATDRNG